MSALRDSAATHSVVVRSVQLDLALANLLISLLEMNVVLPVVPQTRIVQPMLSVSRLPEVSVTAPALQDTDPELMVVAKMSMSVLKVF